MKKKLLKQLIPALFVATALLIAYYFFSIRPKSQIKVILKESKTEISVHRANLLQNRLSVAAVVNLDPTTSSFNNERSSLLQTAIATNAKGLQDLGSFQTPKQINAVDSDVAEFINGELNPKLESLLENNKKILEQQKVVLDDLTTLDQTLNNLFVYDPAIDLTLLDPEKDKEELINRSVNAINGLEASIQEINDSESDLKQKYPNTEDEFNSLRDLLDQEVKVLNILSGQLLGNDFIGAKETAIQIVSMHDQVKSQTLETELTIVKSPIMVELLKNQTNLMLEYDFLINRIDNF